MTRPDPSFRRLVEMFQHERWDDVAEAGEIVATRLLADPEHAALAPVPVLMAGWARAEQGYLPTGIELIERGLRHLDDAGAKRELGDVDGFHLKLVELYLLTGANSAAREQLAAMESLDAPIEVRFPTHRFLASMAVAAGDDTRAAALLGVAESMAPKVGGKDAPLLVAGDRAIWLAATGQPGAASTTAEPVVDRFRKRRHRDRAWRSGHLVAVAAAIAAAAAEVGDTSLAHIWLTRGEDALEHTTLGSAERGVAELALARAALARHAGDHDDAEVAARSALETFQRMGMRPAAAAARLQLAEVALAKGHAASSEPALRSVHAQLVELEQHRLAATVERVRVRGLAAAPQPESAEADRVRGRQQLVPSSGTSSSIR